MKRYLTLMVAVAAMAAITSCEECPLQAYEGGNTVNFWLHTANQSLFGASEQAMPVDTFKLNVHICGMMDPDHDRTFTAAAIEDPAGTEPEKKLTTATPDQYKILDGVIPAGQLSGKMNILLYNKDEYLGNGQTLKLKVGFTENENFKPGLMENREITLSWSREILQPSTWNAMRFFFCGTYSSTVYRIIIEACGIKEFWYYLSDENGHKESQESGYVLGRKFGDYVRNYNATHDDVLRHEDGTLKGEPIVPLL